MKIAYVIDSSTELTEELKQREDVFVAQDYVNFPDGRSLKDNELESIDELLEIMAISDELPKTSQPTPNDFVEVFTQVKAKEYTNVVGLFLPQSKSGTFEKAIQASELVDLEYWIPDLRTISIATTHVLEEAVKYEELDEIKGVVNKTNLTVEAYLTLDNMEYAVKGGRISKLQGTAASLLDIKPLIKLGKEGDEYGDLIPFGRVRTLNKAVTKLYDLISDFRETKHILYAGKIMEAYAFSLNDRLANSKLFKATSGALVANGGPLLAVSAVRY